MLTVKHVKIDGEETLFEAPDGVKFYGSHVAPAGGGPCLAILNPREDMWGPESRLIYRGVAYVMNDNGATIGTYRLGYPPAGLPYSTDDSVGVVA